MSIELKVCTSFLTNHLGISTSRVNRYSSKNIDEIIRQEAVEGNAKAVEYAALMKNPNRVNEFLRLIDPQNRYLIIQNLSSHDLKKLLPHLSKQDLIWGLQYFTQDKLMELTQMLPKKDLLLLVFQNFELEDIIKMMPKDEMDKFLLENDKIEKKDVMKFFEMLDKQDLERIFEQFFGKPEQGTGQGEMLKTIEGQSNRDFAKMLEGMKDGDKQALIINLIENEPKLIMQLENPTIARPLDLLQKPELLESFKVLKPELLVNMVENLPDELLQVVATQIDPQIFAEILVDKFADVLKNIKL
jgi:Mg/Co/Ni transporter MgtE